MLGRSGVSSWAWATASRKKAPSLVARYGKCAEVRALALQRRDVLQHQGVTDPVVRVHAEAHRHDEALRYVVQRGQCRDAGQVLLGGSEASLVAPHQDVRAAVDQDDRVDAVEVGEVGQVGRGVRGDGGEVRGRPLLGGQSGERAEGEVRQVDPFALVHEREGHGQAGIDVEAAARPRDQDAFGVGRRSKSGLVCSAVMAIIVRGARARAPGISRQREAGHTGIGENGGNGEMVGHVER